MVIDFQRVQRVFQAVAELPPVERAAVLERECQGDAELLRRALALLKAHDDSCELPAVEREPIRDDSWGAPRAAVHSIEAGQLIAGRYKLLQQIGEGGMGTVWMAEQTEPVKRRVAVKLIKAGMDSKQVIARFEAERQALALMDHANIARVLDAGTTGALRPYFVMDLVKGVPITRYCDEHFLTPRQRLELFIPVCQAVQHAHQKGIIHRDLKPSNVLVALYDGKPVPKVIDFGVAKAAGNRLTDKTLFTDFGALVGTLEYMSPEQAEINQLDVDTRSDVYSLGVLLYELLTGSPPLSTKNRERAGLLETLRAIREQEPTRPSTKLSTAEGLPVLAANRGTEPAKLTKLVRGELDWIVLKALEKDRNRRYESASAFAADVQRYLADEPVLACPPSAGYRLHKLVRRNKRSVLAASLVLVAMLAGTLVSAWQAVRADHERRIAEARDAETKAVLEFVEKKIFAAARPEGQAGGLGHDVTLRRALEAALPFVDQSFSEQPLIEARLRQTLGVSFANLGEGAIAVEQIERARTLHSQHLGPNHPDTLVSMSSLALTYDGLGRHTDARKLYEETLPLMKAKLGPDDPRTLGTMNNLAINYGTLGQHGKALKLHAETLARRKAKFGADDPGTLATMNNLAGEYAVLGRLDEALKLSQQTVTLTNAKLGPTHRQTLASMDTLASIYHASGQDREAAKLYEETLTPMKVTLGPRHPMTLSTMHDLAGVYAALGRFDEAVKLHEDTLARRNAKLGADHPDTLSTMNTLARLLVTCSDGKVRNSSRAVELAKQAIALAPNEGHYWSTLGVAHYRSADGNAAVAALQKSMELRQGGDSFDWFFLAMAHWQRGDKEAARKWHRRAVEWMQKNKPNDAALCSYRAEAAELLSTKE